VTLEGVYWLGGGSAAGKSTIARRIAARHGLAVYSTDDAMSEHAARSAPGESPLLHEFLAMDMDARWVRRSPAAMLETFHWFRAECFAAIVEDLRRLTRTGGVIAEGFRLLPALVKPLLDSPSHAAWLLPTREFRRAVFASRGPDWGFLSKVSDPAKALANLLERDDLFTERLRDETSRLGLTALDVETSTTEDQLLERVTAALGLSLARPV